MAAEEAATPPPENSPESGQVRPSVAASVPAASVAPVIDEFNRSYGTGRRKSSAARVWIKPGTGRVTVNGKPQEEYFPRDAHRTHLQRPLQVTDRLVELDVVCTVRGGGFSGQAGAVRHGLSRALAAREPTLVPKLRADGLLTRDARRVERKKYGRPKARRSFQFSKR